MYQYYYAAIYLRNYLFACLAEIILRTVNQLKAIFYFAGLIKREYQFAKWKTAMGKRAKRI